MWQEISIELIINKLLSIINTQNHGSKTKKQTKCTGSESHRSNRTDDRDILHLRNVFPYRI